MLIRIDSALICDDLCWFFCWCILILYLFLLIHVDFAHICEDVCCFLLFYIGFVWINDDVSILLFGLWWFMLLFVDLYWICILHIDLCWFCFDLWRFMLISLELHRFCVELCVAWWSIQNQFKSTETNTDHQKININLYKINMISLNKTI